MSTARYSSWDGSQDPLSDRLPVDELADRLSEDVLDGWGIDASLRRLLEEGIDGRFDGLRSLRRRLEAHRNRHRLEGPDLLQDLAERLAEIEATERAHLAGDHGEDARFAELDLDTLPDSTGRRIQALREHRWRSREAASAFEALLEEVRSRLLAASFRRLGDGLQRMSDHDLDRVKDMLADLNRLLEQRSEGLGPSTEDFEAFMQDHGAFFPENPSTFDELLEALARRSMAMSRYLASLSEEQRSELADLMEDLLGDVDLAFEMDRMGRNLRTLAPDLPWDRMMDLEAGPAGLDAGLDAIDRASRLEELDRTLGQRYPGATLDDVDVEAVREALGEDAARDVARLRRIERMLEEAGVVTRSGGRLELTARGVRKLGERALAQVFDRLELSRSGGHHLPAAGGNEEPTGTSRPWKFGDPMRLDLRRTLHNAVVRHAGARIPSGRRVELHPDDFEIEEAETRTATSTVLLLDMSRSMPLRGHWVPAKRMALALHTLISTSFPEDDLHIVGFSDYARVLSPADLAEVDWEPVYGTNMEHAFRLAGRLLAKRRNPSRQVLLVTDGEPTAHLEGEQVFFNWPPVRRTLERTYAEAMRLARSGATVNIFMLEDEPGLTAFVDRLARIVEGRVFVGSGREVGDLIVTDYVRRARSR